MEGIVIKSTGSNYFVRTNDGERIVCKLKGKIRLDLRKTTNPIAVGDKVEIESNNNNEGVITQIYPRKNYIIRKALNLSKQTHILASNIDQAILVATLVEPRTSLGFIDRFLITAEAYSIKAILLFNKQDVLAPELVEIQNEIADIYKNIGYEVYQISSYDKNDVELIREIFQNKTSLLAGHSGVGKSTLINALQPGLQLKTGEISQAHLKGTHTTTFAELHPLDFGGFIIDSPGIKELGLVEMTKEELGHYFPEIRKHLGNCKFNNCIHVNEPGCAVREAFEDGQISPERFESYIKILESEEMDWNKWET
ncbi:MAG: ribosome small subunit-dependent GTPase A [Bacteroidia bacterium]